MSVLTPAQHRARLNGMPQTRTGFGFHSLTDEGLRSVIEEYEAGLASDANYPSGSSRAQVRRWLNAARAALEAR